nr:ABC transporter ATP-binding protein [Leucobacter sp. Ag1]
MSPLDAAQPDPQLTTDPERNETQMNPTTQAVPEAAVSPEPEPADRSRIEPIYVLEGVTKSYRMQGRTLTPLTGVDISIMPGEFATIQGPTGGGKSTLLQLLGALDRPSSGVLRLDGIDLAAARDGVLTRMRAAQIGFVFQSFNLIPTLTANENVNVALEGRGMTASTRTERVAEALAKVGLADRGGHRPSELSGGQQQRVAIARAIVAGPKVLLADEPTGNLDESMRDEILELLEGLNREGLTIVAVTHDSAVAKRAHRRLRLDGGRLHEVRR